jgi:hypothetical protein
MPTETSRSRVSAPAFVPSAGSSCTLVHYSQPARPTRDSRLVTTTGLFSTESFGGPRWALRVSEGTSGSPGRCRPARLIRLFPAQQLNRAGREADRVSTFDHEGPDARPEDVPMFCCRSC